VKILIVKLSALGDVVQTLPSLSLLKKFFPESKIDWVIDKRNAEILEKHPYIDKILVFSKDILFSFKNFKKFLKDLRSEEYDVVIDYQGLLKSGIITGLSKAKYKIGFANHREGSPLFYNFKLPPYDKDLHAVKRYLLLTKEVIKILGKSKDWVYFEELPEPIFSPEILNRKLEFIKRPYIVFVPSARWKTKWWPFLHWEKLIELCKDLAKNFDIFITGSLLEIKLKLWAEEIEKKYHESTTESQKNELEKYLKIEKCPVCEGFRLKKIFLGFSFENKTFQEILEMEIDELIVFFDSFLNKFKKSDNRNNQVGAKLVAEIIPRLKNISEAGLGYLNLNRSIDSLSGGEFQRLRLSNQIYGGLSDIIYVLDEPSIGLHSRDTAKLIKTLLRLKESGNSVIVVEHDKDIIKKADFIIDLGPGAGEEGGKIIFSGNLEELKKANTKTSQYVFGKVKKAKTRKVDKSAKKEFLKIIGAKKNNLKNVSVSIPLKKLVTVAGVSGSGKSSLIIDILSNALLGEKGKSEVIKGEDDFKEIKGVNKISKVVIVDQSPIGRTNRSNAATYTGVFSYIRKLFSETEAARKRGFSASYFSFNMRGGRCEYCQGEGRQKVEMYLLDDVYADCQYCNGTRYNPKMLQIQYHGATIVDVLEMSVDYAFHFFHHHSAIREKLDAMRKVGLGYLKLGQSATELSGGESQRIKLATDIAKKNNEKTLYIFDEPTVGLHLSDIDKLVNVLRGLVEMDCSVIVIEHNLDVISQSDWVIELGPEGGKKGGRIIFEGEPEKLKKADTWTGKFLRKY